MDAATNLNEIYSLQDEREFRQAEITFNEALDKFLELAKTYEEIKEIANFRKCLSNLKHYREEAA